ncbi:hypothetical protein GF407_06280 [candidate division KSB1 bacterium]|nr:hypothetical protein [candidate division KSB1 bacterium]
MNKKHLLIALCLTLALWFASIELIPLAKDKQHNQNSTLLYEGKISDTEFQVRIDEPPVSPPIVPPPLDDSKHPESYIKNLS